MNDTRRSLLRIHLAVLLFGVSGLFGKLLGLPPMLIVLGRVVFSSAFLFLLLLFRKSDAMPKGFRPHLAFAAAGAVLAVHWTAFYESIQVSTVAVGLLSFSTFPVFVSFLEPLVFREKFRKTDLLLALFSLAGLVLVTPLTEPGGRRMQGVLWGVLAGFTYAVLSLLNRKFASGHSGVFIAFCEQLAAAVFLSPFAFVLKAGITASDLLLLALLGVVFTGIAHSLFISGLRRVRASTAGIISLLEPVYGILFALLLLHEIPSARVLLGGAMILGSVFCSTRPNRRA